MPKAIRGGRLAIPLKRASGIKVQAMLAAEWRPIFRIELLLLFPGIMVIGIPSGVAFELGAHWGMVLGLYPFAMVGWVYVIYLADANRVKRALMRMRSKGMEVILLSECLGCKYDTRGLTGWRCPECGEVCAWDLTDESSEGAVGSGDG